MKVLILDNPALAVTRVDDLVADLIRRKARQHLQGFLLRHSRVYPGKKGWPVAYGRWLTMVHFQHPAEQIGFQDYVDAIADVEARAGKLTGEIAELCRNGA